MNVLYALFLLLHVITAAAWFGLALRVVRQARTALAAERSAGAVLAADGHQVVRLLGVLLGLTLAFALGVLFAGGGFSAYGPQYHVSLTLLVLMLAAHFVLVAPAWRQVQAAVEQGAGAGADASAARTRLSIGVGASHLFWLVILVLMFWNQMGVGVRTAEPPVVPVPEAAPSEAAPPAPQPL